MISENRPNAGGCREVPAIGLCDSGTIGDESSSWIVHVPLYSLIMSGERPSGVSESAAFPDEVFPWGASAQEAFVSSSAILSEGVTSATKCNLKVEECYEFYNTVTPLLDVVAFSGGVVLGPLMFGLPRFDATLSSPSVEVASVSDAIPPPESADS